MTVSQLPPNAQLIYRNMAEQLEDKFNLVQSMQRRIKDIELVIGNFSEEQAEEAKPYLEDYARQQERILSAQADHSQLARIHTGLRMWIDQLHINVRYEDVRVREYKLPEGVTYNKAIEALRDEIDNLNSQRNEALHSVPPMEDLYPQIEAFIDAQADLVKPLILINNGKLEIKFNTREALPLVAWCYGEAMRCGLQIGLDEQRKREISRGLSVMDAGLAREMAKNYEEQIVILERKEEAIIRAAAKDGTSIPRRETMSPLAVLSIRPAAARRAQVAA